MHNTMDNFYLVNFGRTGKMDEYDEYQEDFNEETEKSEYDQWLDDDNVRRYREICE